MCARMYAYSPVNTQFDKMIRVRSEIAPRLIRDWAMISPRSIRVL